MTCRSGERPGCCTARATCTPRSSCNSITWCRGLFPEACQQYMLCWLLTFRCPAQLWTCTSNPAGLKQLSGDTFAAHDPGWCLLMGSAVRVSMVEEATNHVNASPAHLVLRVQCASRFRCCWVGDRAVFRPTLAGRLTLWYRKRVHQRSWTGTFQLFDSQPPHRCLDLGCQIPQPSEKPHEPARLTATGYFARCTQRHHSSGLGPPAATPSCFLSSAVTCTLPCPGTRRQPSTRRPSTSPSLGSRCSSRQLSPAQQPQHRQQAHQQMAAHHLPPRLHPLPPLCTTRHPRSTSTSSRSQ